MIRTRSQAPRALVAALAVLSLATCGRETMAPRPAAALAVEATLPAGIDLRAFGLVIDHVRIIAVNSQSQTVFDSLYSFPTNQASLSLQADVPLAQSPESFQITIQELAGTVLLFSGTQSLSLTEGSSNSPAQVPVTYSGPGQNVATLTLGPLDSVLTQNGTLQFRVTAKDGQGAAVANFYVSWTTSDTTVAKVDATGTLKAPLLRRTIDVQAKTPTGVTTSTTVTFVPSLASVAFDSGCAQSGLPGAQLPQPIVARVLGSDGLGVQGVGVQFSAVTAGGSVGTPLATTDTGGRARTLATLPTTAGPASFQAAVSGLTAATCTQTVTSSPPTQLAFRTQPGNTAAGALLGTIQVEVRDASGTLVSGATNAVTLAIGTNPGGGTLTGTKTQNAGGGVASFTGLSIDKAGAGYTLVATASGLTNATSSAFNILAGPVAQLVFTTQPGNIVAGSPFAPPVTVTAEDAQGNTVTTFTGPITLAFGSHPVGSTLGGTVSVGAVAGVATFSSLGLLTVAGGYTLVASASGLQSVVSSSFTVSPGAAKVLAFAVQPTSGLQGDVITPPVVVAVQDTLANVVTTDTNSITVAIGTNPGQASLGGVATKNAASGLAQFTNLTISGPGNGYTLTASASGLTTATSAAFNEMARPPGITWINPSGGNWSTPANWSPARVPGPTDTVSIVLSGASVTLDVNAHVAFLVVGDTVGAVQFTFAPNRRLDIDSTGGTLRGGLIFLQSSDTIGGLGSFTNQGVLSLFNSAITLPFLSNANAGLLEIEGGGLITGSFANSVGGTLAVEGSSIGDATLTVSTSFPNAGQIAFTNIDPTVPHNATLTVTSGSITNIQGGLISSVTGSASTGARTLNATLNNQGSIIVQQTLTIDQTGGSANTGVISLVGGDLNIVLSGSGRPAFINGGGGVITVGTNKVAVTVTAPSGSFDNQAGGTLEGSGTIDIGPSSFITNGTTTVGGAGPGILQFVGSYLSGPDTTTTIFNARIGGSPNNPGVDYDQLQITGAGSTATLQGGQLNVTALSPAAGIYPIITLPVGAVFTGDFLSKHIPANCAAAPSGNKYQLVCS